MPRISTTADGEVLIAHAAYLESALGDMDALVPYIKEGLTHFDGCDTIVGRGLSGALVVPYMARALGLRWAIARKEGDGTHSTENIEGTLGKRWVFVDDLISSGNTLTKTIIAVNTTADKIGYETEFLGAVTYAPYIVWDYDDARNRMPQGFNPNELTLPTPKPDLMDALVASLATPQPTVTDELSAWNPMPKFDSPDVRGFMAVAESFPPIEQGYAELKGKYYTQKPTTPQPVKRGGKKRKLMELTDQQRMQNEALRRKLDLLATNALLNSLQENLR